MYHAIINNLETVITPEMVSALNRPEPPTRPPPILNTIIPASIQEAQSILYSDDEDDDDLDDDKEQFMQIECPLYDIHIEIYKKNSRRWNSLIIEIYKENKIDYGYSIIIDQFLTFQQVYDSILNTVPILNMPSYMPHHYLKFKLTQIIDSDESISSKEFMTMHVNHLPIAQGIIINKTINVCDSCRLHSTDITKKCSACRNVYYCNKECQKHDWPMHKINCCYE